MKKCIKLFEASKVISAFVLASTCLLSSQWAAANWSINGKQIIDPKGNPFIFRGVTINHLTAPERTVQAIKDAASLGANSVQVEIAANFYGSAPVTTGQQLTEIIQACKTNKVICVLEPNDVAGYPGLAGSISPSAISSYWSFSDVRQAILGQQDYVVIGIGNQALGNLSAEEYINRMSTYVGEFRSNLPGFLLLIDGSNWGQDTDKAMQKFAEQNKQSNSVLNNLIYSVDLYDAYLTGEKVRDYIAGFSALDAPLVIGGLAPTPYYHPHNIGPRPAVVYNLPEDLVMYHAEQYGAGYFGWSWSGNQNTALDIVSNWNKNNLTQWGNFLFSSVNGIKRSAKTATIFNSDSSSSSSSSNSTPSNIPPVAIIDYNFDRSRCNGGWAIISGLKSFDADGDALTYEWSIIEHVSTNRYTGAEIRIPYYATRYVITLTVKDGRGGEGKASTTYFSSNTCSQSSSSVRSIIPPSSVPSSTSASSIASSQILPSSISASSASSAPAKGNCTYVVNSQWNNGFTAAIRIKNTGTTVINGWDVNWQYSDDSKITNLWSATLSGTNPYNAKNLNWNSTIQPGQTIEFGFQGSKPAGAASVPAVTGNICQ
ncbi:MAG: hypothetical protein B0W54_19605 [Cellvibrio sp. 79]|nr:MAG: hypothetical protein B0W54_19605 [Cellvibrio sp. 79]